MFSDEPKYILAALIPLFIAGMVALTRVKQDGERASKPGITQDEDTS
jgi:hypothetical protein